MQTDTADPGSIRLQTHHALFALIVQMAGVASGYLLHIALARWMGPAEYGRYSYAMAWIGLLSIATALGLPVCSVRFVAQYRANGQPALLRGAIRRFRQIVVVVGSVVAIVGTASALLSSRLPSWIVVAAWLVPLSSFSNLNTEMARGLGRPGLSQVPDKILRPVMTVVAAAVFYRAAGELSINQAMIAGLSALLAVSILQVALISRVLAPVAAPPQAEYRTREWMQVAVSLLAVSVFVLLAGQIDLFVAGFILEPAQIGIYSAAIRVASLIGFVPLSINIVASPQIAALYSQNDTERLQALASRIAHLSFWPSLVLTAIVIGLAAPILRLFGPEFAAARSALDILALCQLFKAGMGSVGYLLDMTGHQTHNARAFAAATVIGVFLNLLAIPWLGIVGAAAANLLLWMLVTLWLHKQVARRVGVRSSIVSAIRLQPHRAKGW